MKFNDRLWLWLNKKPQHPIQSYLQITVLWVIYGWILGIGLVMLAIAPKAWYVGAALIIISLVMMVWFYKGDKKRGYVNLIHQHWMQRWSEHKGRIESEV